MGCKSAISEGNRTEAKCLSVSAGILFVLTLIGGISFLLLDICHRASWGSAVRYKTRDRIEIITITDDLFDLPLWHLLHRFPVIPVTFDITCKTSQAIYVA